MRYCLDAWAILHWLQDTGAGAERVDEVLAGRPLMSWVNLGEVAYVVERRQGSAETAKVVSHLRRRLDLVLPDSELVLGAASIKALHLVSYADAFALATARAHDAVLITGDPEILALQRKFTVENLRTT